MSNTVNSQSQTAGYYQPCLSKFLTELPTIAFTVIGEITTADNGELILAKLRGIPGYKEGCRIIIYSAKLFRVMSIFRRQQVVPRFIKPSETGFKLTLIKCIKECTFACA
ncbi:hypothetical protein JT31_14380 [Cedecea neteri]|uniref:Uncharacterized protein n=1 Tax=Cedecea neteri TaxID=158822 RepID=A0A089PZD6_9ENTR|nr:hypothetical protein JT31_14380 [Cedecea neteri]